MFHKFVANSYFDILRSLKSGRSESESGVSPRKRNVNHRSRSRDMRRENSEAVWNELARYKLDNRALAQER